MIPVIPKRNRIWFAAPLLVIATLVATWPLLNWTPEQANAEDPPLPQSRPAPTAPDFRLQRTDGKGAVRLADLRGKPVVLIFGSYT